jgi:glucose-1-phosphate cytidylyltransferase
VVAAALVTGRSVANRPVAGSGPSPGPGSGSATRALRGHPRSVKEPARTRLWRGAACRMRPGAGRFIRAIRTMKVVILCGGKGSRSYPFTEYLPKPMMPICGTPLLVWIMRLYARQGFTQFVLAAGHRIEVLRDYFDGRFPEWDVTVLDTGPDADTGERILRCRDHVGDLFYATYGDGIGDVDLLKLLEHHRASGAEATLTTVPLPSQYGTVSFGNDDRIEQFFEKPILRGHWINAGFFVFDGRVFDHWEGRNLENEVFPALVRRGVVYAYRHEGFWKSMDTSKDQEELERLQREGRAPWIDGVPSERRANEPPGRRQLAG